MNVFVYGYYGFGNAGDELLLRRVIEYFKARASNVKFIVRCHDESQTGFENEPVEFVNLDASLSQPNDSKLIGFIRYISTGARLIKNSQAFVFGGGTLFQSSGRIPYTLILITTLCILAWVHKVPVYALGVGVGQLKDGLSKQLFKLILRLVSDFAVRDVTSMTNANFVSQSPKLRLTSDLVFGATAVLGKRELKSGPPESLKHIGLTLAASDSKLTGENLQNLSEQLTSLILEMREKQPSCKISCLTFQNFETVTGVRLSDKHMLERLVSEDLLRDVDFCPMPNNIEDAMKLVSSFDVIMGMRFHGLVLAAMAQVPFIGISRDHKAIDLCKRFDFPSWNVTQVLGVPLFDLVIKALKTKVDTNTLDSCQRLSDANFDEIEKNINRCKGRY
ncbi:polysaccharide pyruvyl transferase family protein [Vibrio scophthalmi]|uniref:polysaccharide pyruvyl transferase family protein n=1 Tax=Vibrio scophthalmi TaxID=45658 RepID=UPI00387360C9